MWLHKRNFLIAFCYKENDSNIFQINKRYLRTVANHYVTLSFLRHDFDRSIADQTVDQAKALTICKYYRLLSQHNRLPLFSQQHRQIVSRTVLRFRKYSARLHLPSILLAAMRYQLHLLDNCNFLLLMGLLLNCYYCNNQYNNVLPFKYNIILCLIKATCQFGVCPGCIGSCPSPGLWQRPNCSTSLWITQFILLHYLCPIAVGGLNLPIQ